MGSLTDIEKQTIVDMKQSGAKLKDIVAETGRNSITIRNYLTSQGFPLYNKRISNDEKELIIKLFESGLNCSQIANQIGHSQNGIKHFLSSKGYDTSSPYSISEEEKDIAIKIFCETHNAAKAARAIGHSKDGVWSMLKKEGFNTHRSVYSLLTEKQIAMIRAMYSAGKTAAEILPLLDGKISTENSIIKIIKDGGIEPRSRGYRNIILNESFFDVIDNEEKAYMTGFLMADGYVIEQKRGRSNTWGITLQTQDKYMLEKFRDLIGCDNKLGYSRNEYVLVVSSEHMVEQLAKYNIVPRKCKTISFPYHTIDVKLYRHVIRGIFDGDGCISGNICSFYGNDTLVSEIQSILNKEIGIRKNKIYKNDSSVCVFSFSSKKDVQAFYHYIYDNSTIYLTRKKDRFKSLPYIS